MIYEELLKDERFVKKLNNGEFSDTFIKEVKAGVFPKTFFDNFLDVEYKDMEQSVKEILSGELEFEIEPVKIPIKKFNKKLTLYLNELGFDANKISNLSKEICDVYKHINSIIGKEFTWQGFKDVLVVSEVCLFDAKDAMLDIV